MIPAAPEPSGPPTLPRVARRGAVGVGVVLLLLHALGANPTSKSERAATTPEQARLQLDPNVATREDLMLLPRIGPALAEYIIEHRESVRPATAFTCADDLENVHRIGPATVAQLRPYLQFPPVHANLDAETLLP